MIDAPTSIDFNPVLPSLDISFVVLLELGLHWLVYWLVAIDVGGGLCFVCICRRAKTSITN